jgi:hypothetical protein
MTTASTPSHLIATAERFIASADPGRWLYAQSEYADELQRIRDCEIPGETGELAYMIGREYAFEKFCEWQYFPRDESEEQRREFTDFDDWLDERGRAPESYIPAGDAS